MIILISCNMTDEPYPVYPLGMSLIANAIRNKGYKVIELDLYPDKGNLDNIIDIIKKNNPMVIGLSIRNIDNVNFLSRISYIKDYKKIITTIKKLTNAPVVLGGAAFSIFPEKLLSYTGGDYGIAGEGEKCFCELLDTLQTGKKIKKKIFYSENNNCGDFKGSYNRNPELAAFYRKRGGMLNIQTKRGCPHRCIYCSYPVLEGKKYRFRDPASVAEEFQYLKKHYNADWIFITDSVFNDAQGNYIEIAEELIKRNNQIPWMCFLRPEKFTKKNVGLLKRAGLHSVEFGTDASSDETLKIMQKDFTWKDVIHSNNIFSDNGVAVSHFVIFGGPGETDITMNEGLNNLGNLRKSVIFTSIGIRVLPNTPIYANLLKNNFITNETNLLEPVFYISENINKDELHELLSNFSEGRKDRIYLCKEYEEYTDRIKAFHTMDFRGPAWDFSLKKKKTKRNKNNTS